MWGGARKSFIIFSHRHDENGLFFCSHVNITDENKSTKFVVFALQDMMGCQMMMISFCKDLSLDKSYLIPVEKSSMKIR